MLTLTQLAGALERLVWENDPRHLPAWRALMIRYLRIGHAVIRELAAGQLTLRAMSLVYTTLLSLVPLLAVSFSVLKGLGVHNQFEPVLQNLLAPMGEQGAEVTARVLEFVENIRAGVLGSLGLGFLIYVVVSMIQKIEGAFNYTWHVSANRSLSQRFSNYLSVILVGPVLIVSALGLTASISHDATVTRLVDMLVLGPLI
jgi:membrane protein